MDQLNNGFEKDKHLKSNPFNTPQNYFDNLPTEISNKISSKKVSFSISAFYKPAFIASFSVLLIITLSIIFQKDQTKPQINRQSALNSKDVYEVILNDETMLDVKESDLIEALVSDSNKLEISANRDYKQNNKNTSSKLQINSDDYYKYLIEEETDIEEL